jgi:hypothetical protein
MYTITLDQPVELPSLADRLKQNLECGNDFVLRSKNAMQRLVKPFGSSSLSIDLHQGSFTLTMYGNAEVYGVLGALLFFLSAKRIRAAEEAALPQLVESLQASGYRVVDTKFVDTIGLCLRIMLVVLAASGVFIGGLALLGRVTH